MNVGIKEKVKSFAKEISTPAIQVSVNEEEYEKLETSEILFPAHLKFTTSYHEKVVFLAKRFLIRAQNILPEGYGIRLIENNNKKYPDETVVGEIFTVQDIGPIPANTVVCIFAIYGKLKNKKAVLAHRSFCISYDNNICVFKPDSYENLLLSHEREFVKKLLEYSDESNFTKSALAESYIENSAKNKTITEQENDFEFNYFDGNGNLFAKCYKPKKFEKSNINIPNRYILFELPSLFELSNFMRKARTIVTALSMVEGYLKTHYGNCYSHKDVTHVNVLPKKTTFTFKGIYLDNKRLVDCEKPIDEVIKEIFKVCKLQKLRLNIADSILYEKRMNIDLYKELVMIYTKISQNCPNAYWVQYDKVLRSTIDEQRKFYQSEFLKQAVKNVFKRDILMLYNKTPYRTKIAKIITFVGERVKAVQSVDDKNNYIIRFLWEESDVDIGNLIFKDNHKLFKIEFDSDEIDKLADFLFAEISFDELIDEYLSPKVALYDLVEWDTIISYFSDLIISDNSTVIASSGPKKCNKEKSLNLKNTPQFETPESELSKLGKTPLPLGKAKSFPGITVAEAYNNPELRRWFSYICNKKENGNFVYTGYYPDIMREYLKMVKPPKNKNKKKSLKN